jgi:hypothetical protein
LIVDVVGTEFRALLSLEHLGGMAGGFPLLVLWRRGLSPPRFYSSAVVKRQSKQESGKG